MKKPFRAFCFSAIISCSSAGTGSGEARQQPESAVPQEVIAKPKPVVVAPHIDAPGYNYFIFGAYAGECSGNCAPMFRYDLDAKGEQLLGDKSNSFFDPGKTIRFTIPIKQAYYINAADSLFAMIPKEILESTEDRTYGCPDCYDAGASYFELGKNGEAVRIYIDPHDQKLPGEIRDFAQRIRKLAYSIEY